MTTRIHETAQEALADYNNRSMKATFLHAKRGFAVGDIDDVPESAGWKEISRLELEYIVDSCRKG